MIVYKITNLINNKCYIGITTQKLKERWEGHLSRLRQGDTRHLYCSMRKYGVENFKIEPIDPAETLGELLEKEQFYIEQYNSKNNGYNMTIGGEVNPMEDDYIIQKHNLKMRSPEVRSKISETMRRKAKDGILFSEEHRKHLSESAMGNHNFGSGDTRSISCYCITDNGTRYDFHSYLDAGKWWYENYKPFGETYSSATYQRKIKKSINGETIRYSQPTKKDYKVITNIKWFKGGDNYEKVNKN